MAHGLKTKSSSGGIAVSMLGEAEQKLLVKATALKR
jgi:hypothetical protein